MRVRRRRTHTDSVCRSCVSGGIQRAGASCESSNHRSCKVRCASSRNEVHLSGACGELLRTSSRPVRGSSDVYRNTNDDRHLNRDGIPDVLHQRQLDYGAPVQYGAPLYNGAAIMTVTGVDLNRDGIPDVLRQPDVTYAGPVLVFSACSEPHRTKSRCEIHLSRAYGELRCTSTGNVWRSSASG